MADDPMPTNLILESNAEVQPLIESWLRSLQVDGKSDPALNDYASAVRSFSAWSDDAGLPVDPALQSVDQLRRYIAVQLQADRPDGGSVSRESVALCFGYLQQWFEWLADQGELVVSPMARLRAPTVPGAVMPSTSDSDLRFLFGRSARLPRRFIRPGS
jgi:site-specific recombinase XerC